ncbi:MAG TPA: dipeptide/oligopeptide/nickel ABC transporter ATP-binding protein [Terriglobales bacterium]|nr:dipeptide/oligopeptide/nickel ABC transporter ATP-binding protein [Terriglobales bacterium]
MSTSGAVAAAACLELQGVSLRMGPHSILREVTLTLRRGETLAVVGPSGAGKSTLGRLAVGLQAPTGGRVLVEGQDLAGLAREPLRRLRSGMQLIYQDPQRSLDPTLPVAALLSEGLELQGGEAPRWGRRLKAWRQRQAEAWLPRVGLEASLAWRHPGELSGGQRQRVAIARALALRPRLLVADEPVAALDASTGAGILKLLADLQREYRLACLLISHQVAQVAGLAQRLAVLGPGPEGATLVEMGPTAEVLAAPRHALTRALLAALPPWPPAEADSPGGGARNGI